MAEEEKDYKILSDDYPSYDLSFKLVVIGDSGVGKSSLTKRATTDTFDGYYNTTIGFGYYKFKIRIKETDIRLQIWDTCGQETYRSLMSSFYRNSSLAILVYSIDSKVSFRNLEVWLNDLKMNSSPDVKIFLIGNKSDLESQREVSHSEAENFYRDHDMNFFLEASAKTGINVEKIFVEASKILFDEYSRLKNKIDSRKNNNNKSGKIKSGQDKIALKADDNSSSIKMERARKLKCC